MPTTFYRQFSASNPPVLRIWPGDTVHTTTVDAGGTDEKGVTRVLGGNPETGPFYVETAMPGDVLVVRLNRVRLNRDWAISDDGIVGRALDSDFAVKMIFIALAVINLQMLRKRVFRDPLIDKKPLSTNAKMLAVTSLFFWLGAITAGRLMAYVGPVSGLSR